MPTSDYSATTLNRRQFLRNAVLAGIGLPLLGRQVCAQQGSDDFMFTQMGVNAGFDRAQVAYEAGADYLLIPVGNFLKPDESEAEFEKQLRLLDQSPIPVLSCNGFLRGPELRSVGPDAKTDNVLRFAETAFKRAKRAGVKHIIFGSAGSRAKPDDWTKAQVDEQFIALLQKMGTIAGAQGIIVAVENLQAKECNYLTRVREVGEIIGQVNHPNVRVLADLYHSTVMEESPEDYAKYAHLISILEIAEKDGRTVPGVHGQDFSPYFQALKSKGFRGPIEIEGQWIPEQLPKAFATIRAQAS
jgi:sugar phosphate isomerase/epimerase